MSDKPELGVGGKEPVEEVRVLCDCGQGLVLDFKKWGIRIIGQLYLICSNCKTEIEYLDE